MKIAIAVVGALLLGLPALAAEEPKSDDDARIKALAEELRRLKLELALPETEYKSYAGMGPAASKVYFVPRGLSVGGYGELTFAKGLQEGARSTTDILRVVAYTGYRFSDRIVFNAEIEFEHGSTEKLGAVNVEFAYLDFKLTDFLSARVGNVLVPIGFINEMHEPAFFSGVARPDVERLLIPSTWNENGLGVYGAYGPLRYKAYVMTGLRAVKNEGDKNEGFVDESWIREGRQAGSKARADGLAGVVNLSFEQDIFRVAGTLYYGRSGQGAQVSGSEVRGDVLLGELHGSVAWRGLSARALFARGTLTDTDLISLENGSIVGSRVQGGYGEVAFDVLTFFAPGSSHSLTPFVRYEAYNLHHGVAEGMSKDASLNRRNFVAGATYKPVPTVALKADFQSLSNMAPASSARTQLNLGAGFIF